MIYLKENRCINWENHWMINHTNQFPFQMIHIHSRSMNSLEQDSIRISHILRFDSPHLHIIHSIKPYGIIKVRRAPISKACCFQSPSVCSNSMIFRQIRSTVSSSLYGILPTNTSAVKSGSSSPFSPK